jgi:hypothetical protein
VVAAAAAMPLAAAGAVLKKMNNISCIKCGEEAGSSLN